MMPIGSLQTHDLTDLTMEDYDNELDAIPEKATNIPDRIYENPQGPEWLPPSNRLEPKAFAHLVIVCIEDFIEAAQTTDAAALRHLSNSLLHGIHSIFPPPERMGHEGKNPIHEKTTRLECTLEFRKEILGWVLDGVTRCVELPKKKLAGLLDLLAPLQTARAIKWQERETLRGRLQHAVMGIPGAKPLTGPLNKAMQREKFWTPITPEIKRTRTDYAYLLHKIFTKPVLARHIVPNMLDFCGTHDAFGKGVGGVWFGGNKMLP